MGRGRLNSSANLPSWPTSFGSSETDPKASITGIGLDSSSHARQIPICQFWPRRVLGATHTTRKPILLLRLSGLLLLRCAERQFLGLLFQEPPRFSAYPRVSIAQGNNRRRMDVVENYYAARSPLTCDPSWPDPIAIGSRHHARLAHHPTNLRPSEVVRTAVKSAPPQPQVHPRRADGGGVIRVIGRTN